MIPDNAKDVVTTMVIIGTGSRYESESIAGISHVLEHMFYKGTEKRPTSKEISTFIEGIGGEFNAFTSKEYTGFYAKVAAKHLEKSIDFLSDLLVKPLFDKNELEKEKQVILQEYDMYQDLPMEIASSKFEEALFGQNPLGRDVIGYRDSIKAVSREDLLRYKADHYQSGNTVIVVAGNISALPEAALLQAIEASFIFPDGKGQRLPEIILPTEKSLNIVSKKTEQTHLTIGFRGASYKSDDRYTIRLLAMILGGSMSSRMFTEIREKLGLAYAVRTSAGNYLDTGMIDTYAGVPHDKAEKAISAILDEYKKVSQGLSEEEFLRAKEIIFGKMLIAFEDTNELSSHYALNELLVGNIITPKELVVKYQDITLAQTIEASREYFRADRMALSLVDPQYSEAEITKYFQF